MILGAFFVALSVPLARRKIRPNHWYGLRVPATLADERVWYEANARAGRGMLVLGMLVMALGALLYLVEMPSWLGITLWLSLIVCGVILFVIRSWRFANRLLERYKGDPPVA